MIAITDQIIDTPAILQLVASTRAGAIVLFVGTARELTGDRRTLFLEYECYAEMAYQQLAALECDARTRWPVIGCAIVHRIGRLEPGEAAVAIAVSCPHRREAFAAGQWLIDTIKQVVPIWKKEQWADGTGEWGEGEREPEKEMGEGD